MPSLLLKLKYANIKGVNLSSNLGSKLNVAMLTARSNAVSWEESATEAENSELLFLQKSENGVDGWKTIHSLVVKVGDSPAPFYLDKTANNTFSRFGEEWYRLILLPSKEVLGPVNVRGTLDPYGAEIAYRHRVRLEATGDGTLYHVFVRARQGIRCPECWDDLMQKRTRVDCPVCNDTSYLISYYNPISTYLSTQPETGDASDDLPGQGSDNDITQAWTANFPIISKGDICIEDGSHAVWCVLRVDVNTHRRVVTKQVVTLQRITGDDGSMRLIKRLEGGPAWQALLKI